MKSDVYMSSYNTTSETRPSVIISQVTSGPPFIEINNLNLQLLQSNLLNTTLNITGKSNHIRVHSKSEIGQDNYSDLKIIKPLIRLVNSSVHQFYGQAIHLEMSNCDITVNTHPPLSPMFVIDNSTVNITGCLFHGDNNTLARSIKEFPYHDIREQLNLRCNDSKFFDPKEISSVLFVFQYSNISITTSNFEEIHVNLTHNKFMSCLHAVESQINISVINFAHNYGKGIIHTYNSDMAVSHSSFFENAPFTSVIIVLESDLSVNGTTFIANTACYGGIFSHGSWNSSDGSYIGENLWYDSPRYFDHHDYSIETLLQYAINGKGINSSKVVVVNTEFINNRILSEGAIFANTTSLMVKNSSFKNKKPSGANHNKQF